MQLTFRWYGPNDPIPLRHIRQIPGVSGIVSALYDVPVGETWPLHELMHLKETVEQEGFTLSVVESIPIHEDVKLGRGRREEWIGRYARSIEHVGQAGIGVVCYNFMPVFDWLRTNLEMPLADGSTCLGFQQEMLDGIDFTEGTGALPGWAQAYSGDELRALRSAYEEVGEEQLWDHLAYFLQRIVPVAEAAGVRLAIHPDDPPWPVAGLPRIITSASALERVTRIVDSDANGVTFCTGSLGADPKEARTLPEVARRLGERRRIHFVHARNVRSTGERTFHESPHPFGDVDLFGVLKALFETDYDGPIRPDHGRMIWGESGRPGYGLYDRALGATYLKGLWEAIRRMDPEAQTHATG